MCKFSQDHIELFFAENSSSWNNNPTTIQFKSSYKQLLMHHMIEGGHGNCTAQDNTKLFQTGLTNVSIAQRYDMDRGAHLKNFKGGARCEPLWDRLFNIATNKTGWPKQLELSCTLLNL